jgi:predicted GNAT superfamily acetyltransferase
MAGVRRRPSGRTGWYLHSHLAGVVASRRRQGIGLALKLHQRQWARARGYSRICWTFDPLRAANAYFNLVRLGVRVVEYRLNQALPTDRLLVEWPAEPAAVDSVMVDHDEPPAFIPIPPDLDAVIAHDPAGADTWLRSVRAKFPRCLMAGYVVTGFDRNASPPRYILRKPGSPSPLLGG